MARDDTFDTDADAVSRSAQKMMESDPDVLTSQAAGRLRSFIERLERLIEDRAAVSADMKEVMSEAKGEGYDSKIIRKVIKLRATDKVKRDEEEAMVDLYLSAIGGL